MPVLTGRTMASSGAWHAPHGTGKITAYPAPVCGCSCVGQAGAQVSHRTAATERLSRWILFI